MKTIVTHVRPHLDEILAVWLFKRYLPEFQGARVEFMPIDDTAQRDSDPDKVYVGIGRGEFDEHKGDIYDCAASLVFQYLQTRGVKFEVTELAGLAKLVEWVREGDTGLLKHQSYYTFGVHSILSYYRSLSGRGDADVMELGATICDALLAAQKDLVILEEDWDKRVEFNSVYGPAVAFVSSARDADTFAYLHGFNLVIFINRERNYHNIRAVGGSDIDLTPIYRELQRVEPDAHWYLHHSKHMIICGGELTNFAKTSKLTLEWIVDALTPNYVRQQRY